MQTVLNLNFFTIQRVRFRRTESLVIALLFTCLQLGAQPSELPFKRIRLEYIPQSLNLSQSSINCILQDREGYLWVGTWSGLIRYNGYSTTLFQSENLPGKLKSNKIATLFEDHNGVLWIGTYMGGLFQYKKETNEFIQYTHDPGNGKTLVDDNVRAIQEDSAGNLWIGTENGLSVKHPDSLSFYNYKYDPATLTSISSNVICEIFLSSSGKLWIGTGHGLCELQQDTDLSRNKFKRYLYEDDKSSYDAHNYVIHIKEFIHDEKSSIWYTTSKGLKSIQGDKIENFLVKNKPTSYSIFLSMLAGRFDKPYLLLGSEEGLNFFDPITKKFVRFLSNRDRDLNLSYNSITSLYLDNGGVLWVGTKKGLHKFDTYLNDFDNFSTTEFDPTNSIITGIQESFDNGYWISTLGGGLFKFKDGKFHAYHFASHERPDFINYIQTLYIDSRSNVWLGTSGSGIYCFNERDIQSENYTISNFRHFDDHTVPHISDNYVMSLTEDKKGNIWVGSWSGGLNKILPDYTVEQLVSDLLRKPLVVLYVDHIGTLWMGTRGNGLYSLDPADKNLDNIHHYYYDKSKTSLSNNFINTINECSDGKLWVGTESGLNVFNRRNGNFNQFIFPDHASNVVVSLLEDNQHKIWIGNWHGLMTCSTDASNYLKRYDRHDNIMGGFFYNNVCLKDSHGMLLFGGSEGFNRIDPSRMTRNPIEPAVHLENFSISNQKIDAGEKYGNRIVLSRSVNDTPSLELKHNENSISLEFASNDFAAPEKMNYAFMLEGFDADWTITSASRRYANYTNLNPGHYTFKVKVSNIDGVWNQNVKTISIIISRPWWQTIWAKIVYVVVGLLLLLGMRSFIVFRTNILHNLKLEKVQRENMEKLNKVKLQFFTNISHELRTPLTLIIGPIQTMLDEIGYGDKFHQQLQIVNRNSQRLLRLVNQLLDFRKVETENAKISAAEGNIVLLMNEVKRSFDPLADKMNIYFSVKSTLQDPLLWFDPDMCEKIFFNLLSNAFKSTPENGEISILLEEEDAHVLISVYDTGTGIKEKYLKNVFQSFFSFDEDRTHASSGIGLAFVKSLVNLHHGTIDVESQENLFSKFTVRFKKGMDHFSPSERIQSEGHLLSAYPEDCGTLFETGVEPKHDVTEEDYRRNKLLIIEDNIEVSDYIRSIFESEFTIIQATDGKNGLSKARESIPDIIISDIMMPEMNGISFCKALKTDVKTSHIPIILLTARRSMEVRIEGLENGADEYVTKPFSPKVLQLKVRNLIQMRKVLQTFFHSHDSLNLEPKRILPKSPDEQFLKMALISVENNMGDADYTVEHMCRDVGMSYTQLYRKIKALTGQTVNDFIKNIRLKRAAQLLEQNQFTIAEVTYQVGFTDLQHFRECFKKLFGVTPSHYIQHQVKNAS